MIPFRKPVPTFGDQADWSALLEPLGRRQYLVSMAIDPHVAPDFGNPSVHPDQNRGANNPEELPAIHGFFTPGAIGPEHLMLLIRNQRNGKLVLAPKRL